MVDKLYVIGNGFDIHLGINSSYKCYMEWLKDKHKGNYSANARPNSLSDGYLNYEPCLNAYQSAK